MSGLTRPRPTAPTVPEGETRIAVRGVPWSLYELWVDSLPERSGIRMAYDGQSLIIERLDPGGRYLPIETSAWIPIKNSEVVRWLTQEDATDESAWARRLRNWVRAELTARRASC